MTPQVLALTHAAAFKTTRPWTVDEFAQLLGTKGVILCGDAKSFTLGRVILDEAEVLTLATHPDFQGRGRARETLAAFETQAISAGAETVFLEVAADNEAAKSLYLSSNFKTIGHRPRYYRDQNGDWIDAIIMQKRL